MDAMNYGAQLYKILPLYADEDIDVKYRIVHYRSWSDSIWDVLTWLIPPLRLWRLPYTADPETKRKSAHKGHVWEEELSKVILIGLLTVKVPLAIAGYSLEWFLNFHHSNNGFVGLFSKLITLHPEGIIFYPEKKNPSWYYSATGWLDPRTDLIYPYSSKLKINPNSGTFDYDSKIFADLCIMASKLAYESRDVQEPIVNKQWNMRFQQFYEFQNANYKHMGFLVDFIHKIIEIAERALADVPLLGPLLKFCDESTALRPTTQAFTFTDKPQDADLVVLAFRGTEPFSADDWSTDFDFSFVEIDDDMGRLHVGFLEALGLVDREDIKGTSSLLKKYLNDPNVEVITGLSPDRIKSMAKSKSLELLGHKQYTSPFIDHMKAMELALKIVAFERISADLMQLLKENPKARLVVTGHSLGGALAAMFAAIVLSNNVEKSEKKLLVKSLEAVYTFGQPRIGDKVFARFIANKIEKYKVKYHRVVYAYDLVPRVPFDDAIFGFKHLGFCCYSTIFMQQKALIEQPNKNFSDIIFSPVMHICAAWELVNGILLNRVLYGDDFCDSSLMALARLVALLVPGMVAHAPTNYVNAVRLGPSRLRIVPYHDSL